MSETATKDRFERMQGFLEQDPANAMLLRDTAHAALEADELEQAKILFARLKETGELTDGDSNMWAIAAMRSGEPEQAVDTFSGLLESQPENKALRFNLAWARALAGDREGARDVLDPELTRELPQAAQLEVQLMHQAGEFEQAAEQAKEHLKHHGDYGPLLAAVSVLAMDVDDEELARECAQKASGHPDAMTTLATLTLGEQKPEAAKAMFEQALSINDKSPRAWVGLGLAEMLQGDSAKAAQKIDRGAEIFGSHLGSWIAAGWAYLLAGDMEQAAERFRHAVELDGTFAEAQGSLAVVELMQGKREEAENRLEVALRLDRQSFSAAFGKALISAGAGDAQSAQRIVELAMKQPMGPNGMTIADAIARMAR